MKCMITRLVISLYSDFDRALPSSCERHVAACRECREFAAVDGGLYVSAHDLAPRARAELRPADQALSQKLFLVRLVPASAVLAALLLMGLILGNLPRRTSPDSVGLGVASLIEADVAGVDSGADFVLGATAEDAMQSEMDAWRAEIRGLLASIPVIPLKTDG